MLHTVNHFELAAEMLLLLLLLFESEIAAIPQVVAAVATNTHTHTHCFWLLTNRHQQLQQFKNKESKKRHSFKSSTTHTHSLHTLSVTKGAAANVLHRMSRAFVNFFSSPSLIFTCTQANSKLQLVRQSFSLVVHLACLKSVSTSN